MKHLISNKNDSILVPDIDIWTIFPERNSISLPISNKIHRYRVPPDIEILQYRVPPDMPPDRWQRGVKHWYWKCLLRYWIPTFDIWPDIWWQRHAKFEYWAQYRRFFLRYPSGGRPVHTACTLCTLCTLFKSGNTTKKQTSGFQSRKGGDGIRTFKLREIRRESVKLGWKGGFFNVWIKCACAKMKCACT